MNTNSIKTLIQQGDLKDAASRLVELAKSQAPKYQNEAMVHFANIKKVLEEERRDLRNPDDIRREKSRLMYALLDLLEEIEPLADNTTSTTVDGIRIDGPVNQVIIQQGGTHISSVGGDFVAGDQRIGGDKVGGDKATTGDIDSD